MNKDFNICNAKIAEDLLTSGKTKVYMLNTNWRMLDEFVKEKYDYLIKNKKVMSSTEFIDRFEGSIKSLILDCGILLKRTLKCDGTVEKYISFNDKTLKGYELYTGDFMDNSKSSCYRERWGFSYKKMYEILIKDISKKYNDFRYSREITKEMPLYALNSTLQHLKENSLCFDTSKGVNIYTISGVFSSCEKFVIGLYNGQDLGLVDNIKKICENKNYIEINSIEHCSNEPIKIVDINNIDVQLIYLYDNMTNKASKLNVYFTYNGETIKLSKIYNYYVPCKISMKGKELLSITPDNEGKVTF